MSPSSAEGAPAARVVLPFLVVTAIWGSTWLVIKGQISSVPAEWSVTYRFLVASIGMAVLARAMRRPLGLPRQAWGPALVVGIAQFVGNYQFVYGAELHLTSGIVAVIYALLVVPNAALAWIFLRQSIGGRFVAGSMVAMAGIALLMLHEYREAPPAGNVGLGLFYAVVAMLCASVASIVQAAPTARKQEPIALMFWAMLSGFVIDAAFAFVMRGAPTFDPRPAYVLGIAYLAILGTVVTFPLNFVLIREMGAARSAYNSVAVPVVAMALSTVFEGYRWTWLAGIGSVLALAGLAIALSGRVAAAARIARSPSR